MNATSSSSRDPEATQKALLDAAEALFLKKGFGNTSLAEIARKAGITKSLIHHYFGSKTGLWQEVKSRRFIEYSESQKQLMQRQEPSVELLRASLTLFFYYLKANPEIVRILAWMFLEQDHDCCIHVDKELMEEGIEKLKASQAAGKIRDDIDPRFILFTFISLAQQWFQDKSHFINDFGVEGLPEDLDEAYLKAVTRIFFEGILP